MAQAAQAIVGAAPRARGERKLGPGHLFRQSGGQAVERYEIAHAGQEQVPLSLVRLRDGKGTLRRIANLKPNLRDPSPSTK